MSHARPRIGLFGGTFDPVHIGHLTLARWARAELALDRLRLIPTGESWQKRPAWAPAADRLEMARLAFAHEPWVTIDEREVHRDGPSYTIDTLIELRRELGPEPALVLLLGSDQLHNLATWHRYRELLDHAHLAITQRERVTLDGFAPEVEALIAEHGTGALPDAPAGALVFFRMPSVAVSATVLRRQLAAGERPAELVPPTVLEYIDRRRLYRPPGPPEPGRHA